MNSLEKALEKWTEEGGIGIIMFDNDEVAFFYRDPKDLREFSKEDITREWDLHEEHQEQLDDYLSSSKHTIW